MTDEERTPISDLCNREICFIKRDRTSEYLVLCDEQGKPFAQINAHDLFDADGNCFRFDIELPEIDL